MPQDPLPPLCFPNLRPIVWLIQVSSCSLRPYATAPWSSTYPKSFQFLTAASTFLFNANSQLSSAGPSQPNQLSNSQGESNGIANFVSGQTIGVPLSLDKARFEMSFKSFCQKRGLKPDPRILSIDPTGRTPSSACRGHQRGRGEQGGQPFAFSLFFYLFTAFRSRSTRRICGILLVDGLDSFNFLALMPNLPNLVLEWLSN